MTPFDPKRYDRHIKIGLLFTGLLTLALLSGAAIQENLLPEWRQYREEYAAILVDAATDDMGRDIAARFQVSEIEQNVLPELNRTDRCVTCHTGVDDPRMADREPPFGTHPAGLLEAHPPSRFGCTICHRGQGRALDVPAAHGHTEDWLEPIYEEPYMYSACAVCHDAETVFDERFWSTHLTGHNGEPDIDLVARGKQLSNSEGCLGCHMVDGTGGTLGPDITFVGDKTRHDLDFTYFHGDEPSVTAWLEQHFLDPGQISPGTSMPDMNLTPPDAEALTAYVLSLREKDAPASYAVDRPLTLEPPPPQTGGELYAMLCSACHGENGQESEVPGLRTPALNNPDTLAVASDDYLRFIIANGRSNSAMPAWGPEADVLTRDEIDRLVEHIRKWEATPPDLERISSARGDPRSGRSIYMGLCANCHGESGEGGIGVTLNSPTFLGLASDRFLADTIVHGRPNTAMASWKHLSAQNVSDILAHIRTWQSTPPSFNDVQESLAAYSKADNVRYGKSIYDANCAGCHGNDGEGGIGIRLNSPNIVPAVDDRYLYTSIVHGRPSTAMPAWRHLSSEAIAGLIAYLRSLQADERIELPKAPPRGNYDLGRVHYDIACADCHGDRGQGGVGPQLVNDAFLRTASDDLLYYWISSGRTGTAMEGFAAHEQGITELEPHHIADVIAFIRHLAAHDDPPLVRTGIGDPNVGRQLFEQNCASCHGVEGQGASGPQLRNAQFLSVASDGFLAGTIVTGREGTPMLSMIHGYEGLGQIEPDDVQDIIAYMRLWDVSDAWSEPRPVAEMSQRAIASGRSRFAQFCAGCHGPRGLGTEEGEGFFAPALNNPEFLHAASDGFLLATIARGRSNTPMRPFGDNAGGIASLNAGDIFDIVSFIRSWQNDYLPKGD